MHRVLLAEPLDPPSEERLAAAAEVLRASDSNEATLARLVRGCDALVCRTSTAITRRILESADRLRVVGVAGVGLDRIDLHAAAALGIRVVNTPAAATDAVADLALLFILELLRPVRRLTEQYRQGGFTAARAAPHGRELRELTVGIVGMGRIGSALGRRCAAGFGARVLYNDILPVGPFDFPAQPVEKAELWARSDIVTLHVPLDDRTRHLVDADVLRRMRPDAFLLNTARGGVVATDALTAALARGELAGAALDVTDPEPLPTDHPLLHSERCLVTPHIAARTTEGLRRMCAVVDAVLAVLGTP